MSISLILFLITACASNSIFGMEEFQIKDFPANNDNNQQLITVQENQRTIFGKLNAAITQAKNFAKKTDLEACAMKVTLNDYLKKNDFETFRNQLPNTYMPKADAENQIKTHVNSNIDAKIGQINLKIDALEKKHEHIKGSPLVSGIANAPKADLPKGLLALSANQETKKIYLEVDGKGTLQPLEFWQRLQALGLTQKTIISKHTGQLEEGVTVLNVEDFVHIVTASKEVSAAIEQKKPFYKRYAKSFIVGTAVAASVTSIYLDRNWKSLNMSNLFTGLWSFVTAKNTGGAAVPPAAN